MKPFAQDEGKELVDKTKLNVLLKLFNRNDWLLFNISFNIMSMPYRPPGKAVYGAPTYTTTHRNKNVNGR